MNIDNKIVEELTTLKSDVAFKCDSFGLVNSKSPNTLSFIDDEKFLEQLILNKNISVVFSTPELKDKIIDRILIVSDDPRFYFYDVAGPQRGRFFWQFVEISLSAFAAAGKNINITRIISAKYLDDKVVTVKDQHIQLIYLPRKFLAKNQKLQSGEQVMVEIPPNDFLDLKIVKK